MDFEILDDLISLGMQDYIERTVADPDFPWYYNNTKVDKESKDDFANMWIRFQYEKKFGAFKAYAKIQPKFAIDRDGYDNGEYYEAQNNYGVDYKVSDKLTVGVYLEQNHNDDWDVKSEFVATKISYKF